MIYSTDFEHIAAGLPIREGDGGSLLRVISSNSAHNYVFPLAHFYAPCSVMPTADDRLIASGLLPAKFLRKALDGSDRSVQVYAVFSGVNDGESPFEVHVSGDSGVVAVASSGALSGEKTVALVLAGVSQQDVLNVDLRIGKGKNYLGNAYISSMTLYAIVGSYYVRDDFMAVNSTYSQDRLNTMAFLADDLKALGISRASMMFMAESAYLKKHENGKTCGFPHRLASTVPVKDGPYCIVTKPHERYVDVTVKYKAQLIGTSADGSTEGRATLCVVAAHETPGATVWREVTPVSGMVQRSTFRIPANQSGPTWFYVQFCSGGNFAFDSEQADEGVPKNSGERDYLVFDNTPGVEALFDESASFKFCVSKALGVGESTLPSEFVRIDDIAGAWKKTVASKLRIVVLKEPESRQTFAQKSYVVRLGHLDVLGICACGVYEPTSRSYPAMVPASATIHKGLVRNLIAGYEACLQQQLVMRQHPFQSAGTLATPLHTYGPWCPALQMCNDLIEVPAYPGVPIFWDRAAPGLAITQHRVATVLGVPVTPMVSPGFAEGTLNSPGINIKLYYASYLPRKDDNAPICHKWLVMLVRADQIRLYMSGDYSGVAPPRVLGGITEEFDKAEYVNKHSQRLTRYMDTLSPDLWTSSPAYARNKSQLTKQFFYQEDLERESGAVVRESATIFVGNEDIAAAASAIGGNSHFLVVENVMANMDRQDGSGQPVGMQGRGFYDSHAIVVGFAAWYAPAEWKLPGSY